MRNGVCLDMMHDTPRSSSPTIGPPQPLGIWVGRSTTRHGRVYRRDARSTVVLLPRVLVAGVLLVVVPIQLWPI